MRDASHDGIEIGEELLRGDAGDRGGMSVGRGFALKLGLGALIILAAAAAALIYCGRTLAIDRCLDSGGRWEGGRCEH